MFKQTTYKKDSQKSGGQFRIISTVVLCLVLTVAHGQSKNCNTIYERATAVHCTLTVYKKVGDTLFATMPQKCNVFHFDSTANGQWKIYSADTTTLLEIVGIQNGQRNGTDITFYKNGQIECKATYKDGKLNGDYISFYETTKVYMKGSYKLDKRKQECFTGTITEWWDNGNIAHLRHQTDNSYFDKNEKYYDKVENMGKLYDALQIASENNPTNFVIAKNSINTLAIIDPIEDYLKTVIDMSLEKQISGIDFGNAELLVLRSIAAMCPYNEGTGVYIARSLLVPYDPIGTEYENACETEGTRTMSFENEEPVSIISDHKFLLFPNPNNGNMIFNYEINETDNANLFIYDITGRKISDYKLKANSNSLVIKESELSNGIYLYKVIINGKMAKSDRLVIIK